MQFVLNLVTSGSVQLCKRAWSMMLPGVSISWTRPRMPAGPVLVAAHLPDPGTVSVQVMIRSGCSPALKGLAYPVRGSEKTVPTFCFGGYHHPEAARPESGIVESKLVVPSDPSITPMLPHS